MVVPRARPPPRDRVRLPARGRPADGSGRRRVGGALPRRVADGLRDLGGPADRPGPVAMVEGRRWEASARRRSGRSEEERGQREGRGRAGCRRGLRHAPGRAAVRDKRWRPFRLVRGPGARGLVDGRRVVSAEGEAERDGREDSAALGEGSESRRWREVFGVVLVLTLVVVLAGLLSLGRLLALGAVPPVLDLVVAAVGAQAPGDLRPPLSALVDHPHDLSPFLVRDGRPVQPRLEVLCVPLPALLGRPDAQPPRDAGPVWPVRGVQFQEENIFFPLPVPLVKCLIG